ncbi:hypothetical protein BDR05DRAFT_895865, partial [Suillus weaverae]
ENLLPKDHNTMVLDLLFDLATWHGFAKLRQHTEDTLDCFDTATIVLGQTIRKFNQTTCAHYHTTELPHKHAARSRRKSKLASQNLNSNLVNKVMSRLKRKRLNLNTYKYHALGDYPDTI